MEANKKFLWGYTVTIFVVALSLIIITSVSANSYKNEVNKNIALYEGAQKSVQALTLENGSLKTENTEAQAQISNLEQEKQQLSTDLENQKQINENNQLLFSARKLYKQGKKAECQEALEKINPDLLSEDAKKLYDELK